MRKGVPIRIVSILMFFILLIGSVTIVNADRFNMSYLYGNYNYARLVNRTNGALNEVSPSYFDLNKDGSLALNTVDTAFVKEMHTIGVRVVPFLSNHWDREKGRAALANANILSTEIVNAILKYNLDGVNVDIENVTAVDKEEYINLVRLLRNKLPVEKIVAVSVAANPYGWTTGWHGSYDYTKLAQYADYLMIMAYDEHYESGEVGAVAGIRFVEKSIQYALTKTTKDKIVLGLPFYGRYWQNGASYGGYGVSINKIEELLSKYKSSISYDSNTQSAKAVITIRSSDAKPSINGRTLYAGTYTFWYENEASIKAKLKLVNQYDLKGTGSWSLGQESESVWQYYKVALNDGYEERIFEDIANDRWSKQAIQYAKEKGYMIGKTTTLFKPTDGLTRAEFATIIARAQSLTISEDFEGNYTDIGEHWAERSILAVTNANIMDGYTDGSFHPNQYITREEVAKVLSLLNLEANQTAEGVYYKDLIKTSWSYEYIIDVTKKGFLTGYPDNTFLPKKIMTREEIATILQRTFQ